MTKFISAFVCVFETGSQIDKAGLELTMWPKITLNF